MVTRCQLRFLLWTEFKCLSTIPYRAFLMIPTYASENQSYPHISMLSSGQWLPGVGLPARRVAELRGRDVRVVKANGLDDVSLRIGRARRSVSGVMPSGVTGFPVGPVKSGVNGGSSCCCGVLLGVFISSVLSQSGWLSGLPGRGLDASFGSAD